MPCDQLSRSIVCPWWDESGQTASNISLHRLDQNKLPVSIQALNNRHPLFIHSSAPPIGFCSDGLHDCLRAYENIGQIMEVISNIVRPLINNYNSNTVSFNEYDTLSFIVLDQDIDLSRFYIQNQNRRFRLHNSAYYILSAQKVIFGQYIIDGIRHSAAIQLEIVAHEFCHMLISKIPPSNCFSYEGESAALEESFCDIFAVLISGRINGTWNWRIGQNMCTPPGRTLRNFACPGKSNPPQPSHYSYRYISDRDINEYAHINCGIHNKAFYHIIKSPYFEVDFLIKLLIRTILTIKIADFSHSREAMQKTAKDMLTEAGLGYADITTRVEAVSRAFNRVGIELPEQRIFYR